MNEKLRNMSNNFLIENVNKTVTSFFPRINRPHFVESSIERKYKDNYFPVNNWEQDGFIEFRVPKTNGVFIDLTKIFLQFHAETSKITGSAGQWSTKQATESGDHFDTVDALSYTLFKHLTIDFNGIQVVNESNYSLRSYIDLITEFPAEEVDKLGQLFHLIKDQEILEKLNDDTPFSGLSGGSLYERIIRMRNKGLYLRSPLIIDVCRITPYLIDKIDIIIRFTLHDDSFIFFTNQQQSNVGVSNAKKYSLHLSDISLEVMKIKPTENSYIAFEKSLMPLGNSIPTLDYIYMSNATKQYLIPAGSAHFSIDMPFNEKIPEKIFFCFQKYNTFLTRDFKINGLYLSHLDISNIYITINRSTIFNVNCDFGKENVSEIYNNYLSCVDKHHLLTYSKFLNGMTLFAFPLANFDISADIRTPFTGTLRMVFSFKKATEVAAICYLIGNIQSVLSTNYKREIFLYKH